MELSYNVSEKEKSEVSLKVTVNEKEIKEEYNTILLDVQKNAQIAGFRKGKVPSNIILTKFKNEILADVSSKIIEKALHEVLEKVDRKPISYSIPKLENFKPVELGIDYTFEVLYDVFPTFEISDYKNIEIEKEEVKIVSTDVDEEIKNLTRQHATVEPKIGKIEKDDIVRLDYTVFLNNIEIDNKINEHIYVGKYLNKYKIDDEILGLKKDEIKEFNKTFQENEIEDIKNKTFLIKVKINEVKNEIIPILNDDLAKQIDDKCTSVKDLTDKIKENIEKYSTEIIESKVLDETFKKIIETFKGSIPNSMIEKQQEMQYQNLLYQTGGNEQRLLSIFKNQNLTKEQYLDKMKDNAIFNMRKGLIIDKIIKNEKLQANDDEVNNHVKPISEKYKMSSDELIKMYKDAGNYEVLLNEVETKKAIDFLKSVIKIKKGKKVSYQELIKIKE